MRRSLFAALALLASCKDPPPECTTATVDVNCGTQYVPTFDNLYVNTMEQRCGTRSGSCHSASGDSGLSFADRETAYTSMLTTLTPGNPTCSELVVRTIESGTDYQMPPDATLAATDRCAFVKWVAAGAPGPGQPLPTMGAVR